MLRERSWGENHNHHEGRFQNQLRAQLDVQEHRSAVLASAGGESIADVAENRVHNLLTSLNRKSDAESVVMVSHGDLMLALMLTLEDLSDEEFMHRAAPTNGRSPTARASIIRAVIRRPGVRISGSVGSRRRVPYSTRRMVVGR